MIIITNTITIVFITIINIAITIISISAGPKGHICAQSCGIQQLIVLEQLNWISCLPFIKFLTVSVKFESSTVNTIIMRYYRILFWWACKRKVSDYDID
jgi:hypothetical protein